MSDANKFWAIAFGGVIVGWLIAGLPWGLIVLCGFITYALGQRHALLGGLFALGAAVFFFGPGAVDQRVLAHQVARIEAQEASVAPIDMTGRRVLFVGGTRYVPWDCSDLCRAVVAGGVAEAVYFGHDRSLDLSFGNGPVDLTGRTTHTFPPPLVPGLPEDTPSVPTPLGEIDYIVVEGPYFRASERELLPDVPTYGGIFRLNTLRVEYMVFEADDLTAFDPLTQTPIITRFAMNRHAHSLPSLPFLALGDLDFSHQYSPGLSQWVTSNAREVGAMLCGPQERPFYHDCAVVRR